MILMLKDKKGNNVAVNYNVTYKRVKNVNMRLGKDNIIEVSMSKRVSQRELIEILYSKSDWILKVLEKNKNKNDYKIARELAEEDKEYFLLGKKYDLIFLKEENFEVISESVSECEAANTKTNTQLADDLSARKDIRQTIKQNMNLENIKIDEEKNIIYLNLKTKKWKQELNRYEEKLFIARIRFYLTFEMKQLSKYNLPVKDIRIKTLKSCWGSCQVVKKEITLNRRLVSYNEQCLRYVIIHELAHLVHANHSKEFYQIIESVMPNYKAVRKELNES